MVTLPRYARLALGTTAVAVTIENTPKSGQTNGTVAVCRFEVTIEDRTPPVMVCPYTSLPNRLVFSRPDAAHGTLHFRRAAATTVAPITTAQCL